MRAEDFAVIEKRAAERKGGSCQLSSLLSQPKSSDQLAQLDDSYFLAEFTRKVFQSGFVWRVVNQKWTGFERVFFKFDLEKILLMPDEMLEKKATDPDIIRNLTKVRTVRDNALMIKEVSDKHGSFGKFIADWPQTDLIGLWRFLQKNGARLGGNTGAYALRFIGLDSFLISRDIEAYFRHYDLISGGVRSKASLSSFQNVFNYWHSETGYPYTHLSQILAYSIGDNHVGTINN